MAAINKADAEALLARQNINTILQDDVKDSVALASFRTLPMSAGTAKMPVLAALPTAGFVTCRSACRTAWWASSRSATW